MVRNAPVVTVECDECGAALQIGIEPEEVGGQKVKGKWKDSLVSQVLTRDRWKEKEDGTHLCEDCKKLEGGGI
jgi:uncharacterized protein YlaI